MEPRVTASGFPFDKFAFNVHDPADERKLEGWEWNSCQSS